MNTKAVFRQKFLEVRSNISIAEKKAMDSVLNDKLHAFIAELKPKVVHTYLPIGSEIDIYPLIDFLLNEKITLVCPKALNKPFLQHFILTSIHEIEQGRFATLYPKDSIEYKGDYDLIIVPGLAYTSEKYRLGYGGGYYDYFLAQQPSAIKLGLFYTCQKADDIPIEGHDIPLDLIITN
ncbi:MAG: 5-formyltetrahydrofolate cyclo-ligase [Chitinophagales bacterium]|nr:5-formyltetrahydrofolate cyclo-ligase [Sphingobacteriales bacterium]